MSKTVAKADSVISNGCGCQETNGGQAGDVIAGCSGQKSIATTSDVEAKDAVQQQKANFLEPGG